MLVEIFVFNIFCVKKLKKCKKVRNLMQNFVLVKLIAYFDKLRYVLPVFIVCYGIANRIREITRGSIMCRNLTANDLIYDQMK